MGEWIDFSHWEECKAMERPGYVFEVMNTEEQRMVTPCTIPLEVPFDWSSPPVMFRVVPESVPRHSEPLPPSVSAPAESPNKLELENAACSDPISTPSGLSLR